MKKEAVSRLNPESEFEMADVMLTKQAAARRLISSAVILASVDGDPLAVHLLAASALSLLRELIRARGPDYTSRLVAYGLFDAARRMARGESLPFAVDARTNEFISLIADEIRSGRDITADDIRLTGKSREHEMLSHIIRPFNFMKHADRDPLDVLEETEFRPAEAVMHAVSAYTFVFPDQELDFHVQEYVEDNINKVLF